MNGPQDAFSESAFRPPGFRRNDWQPPLWARTAVWLVKDLGVSVTALIVVTAVLLGWVDSPLMRLRDIDSRTLTQSEALGRHTDATLTFQLALLESLRKQRCMTALSGMVMSSDTLTKAALAADPCVFLENLPRRGP